MKNKNSIWAFFASVKLALFIFFILAGSSIVGTIIPQGKEFGFYVQNFGPGVAKVFQVLNVPDMYNSFWFLSFLVLFSLNLIVCTIDRLPNLWRLVVMDNLGIGLDRITKMPHHLSLHSSAASADVARALEQSLAAAGWKGTGQEKDGGRLFFSQKGAWTRLGVIGVHVSILIIFVGAIIGSIWGQKGGIMITEGSKPADYIYAYDGKNTMIPLGFAVRCDKFELSYYDSGAPKEYRSELAVIKDGQEVLTRSIVVNDPMDFGGYTFYQSSFQAIEKNYVIGITNQTTGEQSEFYIVPRQQFKWPEKNLTFGIINQQGPFMGGRFRHKIWFSDGKADPSEFWADEGQKYDVQRVDANYQVSIRPRYATGLQVAKDPGVWWVYAGCCLMLLGLYVAFFMAHRKIWALVSEQDGRVRILLAGSSNKNKVGFANEFDGLAARLSSDERLNLIQE